MAFGIAVRLVPLEKSAPVPAKMSTELCKRREHEREFLNQLVDGKFSTDFEVKVPISQSLRRYQQDGVNWLAFLHKFNLHGVLCDDMGLGKTLQTLCVIASDTHTRRERFTKLDSMDSVPLPSLVVCPSTLVNHWCYEISKFLQSSDLYGVPYLGDSSSRQGLRRGLKERVGDNVLVMSYNTLRSDIQYFSDWRFNYCVLDEGHVIKNPTSKISEAVKQVIANRRLILSGTPIQNNVVELWSLFDFLMPGYLGDRLNFQNNFAKPIAAMHGQKVSDQEQEAGTLALEALHKQVLPFLLRRMKEDVLSDLPPKIIQDFYCDLSPLQSHLYESFGQSVLQTDDLTGLEHVSSESASKAQKHIFSSIRYLLKLCSHPKLVMDNTNALSRQEKANLDDVSSSGKVSALK